MKFKVITLDKNKNQRLLKKGHESLNVNLGHVVLRKDENIGEHITDNVEEVLVILDGEANIIINREKMVKGEKDSIIYIGPNTLHDVKNTGSKILRYIYITCSKTLDS